MNCKKGRKKMQANKKQDYRTEISTNVTPQEAIDKINHVSEWWSKNFEGKSSKVNDVFTVRFPSGDMYKIRVAEIVPNEIVWEIMDAFQGWVKNTSEWKGTQIEWEIKEGKKGVTIVLTHVGLVPELECFDRCNKGWDYLMHQSLSKYLTEGKGLPV
jgi:Activator of Hsp90 ATPase homolog 1-like protein